MTRNPDRNYAIHWLDQSARDAAVAALTGATGTGGTGGTGTGTTDPTVALGGDLRGELLGPQFVVGIHGDEITLPAFASDPDDFDPAGREALLWRLDFAGFALTGIAAPNQPGEWHVLAALGAGTLMHEDANSAAANRFLLPDGVDLDLPDDGAVIVTYDGTSTRWRVIGAGAAAGLTPASYTISNDTTDRALDADSTTLNELADVVATLIRDLGGA